MGFGSGWGFNTGGTPSPEDIEAILEEALVDDVTGDVLTDDVTGNIMVGT